MGRAGAEAVRRSLHGGLHGRGGRADLCGADRPVTLIAAKNISKRYDTPRDVAVLDDVSLALERGESAAIMGPSGCGKSTLLYMLGALEPPSSGTVTIDGRNPFDLSERRRRTFAARRSASCFRIICCCRSYGARERAGADAGRGTAGAPRDSSGRARRLLEARRPRRSASDHRPARAVRRRAPARGDRARAHPAAVVVLCDEPTGNLDRASAEDVADLSLSLHREERDDARRRNAQSARSRRDSIGDTSCVDAASATVAMTSLAFAGGVCGTTGVRTAAVCFGVASRSRCSAVRLLVGGRSRASLARSRDGADSDAARRRHLVARRRSLMDWRPDVAVSPGSGIAGVRSSSLTGTVNAPGVGPARARGDGLRRRRSVLRVPPRRRPASPDLIALESGSCR